jgi:hypothetical protein
MVGDVGDIPDESPDCRMFVRVADLRRRERSRDLRLPELPVPLRSNALTPAGDL